ncbi:MAG: TolC family protein [Gemmatimonadaceae bacterium]
MKCTLFIVWAIAGAHRLTAQPAAARVDTIRLTLQQARARALNANPELLAARLDTTIARGELHQAAVVFRSNPTADLLATGGGNGAEVGLTQEIEIFGQRGQRVSAGRAGFERAGAAIANSTRLLIGAIDRSFYRLVSANRRLQLAEEVLALNQRLADVAQRQLAAGEISRLNFNLAVIELGRSRSRALASARERDQTSLELQRLIGVPRERPIEAALDITLHTTRDLTPLGDSVAAFDVERLTQLAMARRPDLLERGAAARQADAQASAVRREAWPNLLVRGASEPRTSGNGRALRPGVGLTLPVFNQNRGAVAARRAAAQQFRLDRDATASRVRTEIATAVAIYRSAAAEVDILESTVLGPARQNRQLLEIAYREGEVGLAELLLIRNQVSDAELGYWTAWLAEREAVAALLEATGTNVEPLKQEQR